jgi:hypothetical protein
MGSSSPRKNSKSILDFSISYSFFPLPALTILRGENFEDFINPNSLNETTGFGDPAIRTLNKGDKLQVERKDFYIVDSPFMYPNTPAVLVQIPDGSQKEEQPKKKEQPKGK